jgi:protein gp37
MGVTTKIEWTDATFNPWIGCTKVSAGCAHCYAKRQDDRHIFGQASHWGVGAARRRTSPANWGRPILWARAAARAGIRKKVFCASLADVFDEEAPVGAQRDLFELIRMTAEWLDWQLLTKRPERIAQVLADCGLYPSFFPDNRCWLGVSTENQAAADARIPVLLQTQAAVRFISAEPLLGPLDLTRVDDTEDGYYSTLDGLMSCEGRGWKEGLRLDQVICGGESGPEARPMHPDWARSLRNQCGAAGMAFFFKGWGEWFGAGQDGAALLEIEDSVGRISLGEKRRFGFQLHDRAAPGALLDGREWHEFPEARRP